MLFNSSIDSSKYVCLLCSPGYFASPDFKSCQISIPNCSSVSDSSTCYPFCNCSSCETGFALENRDEADLAKGKVYFLFKIIFRFVFQTSQIVRFFLMLPLVKAVKLDILFLQILAPLPFPIVLFFQMLQLVKPVFQLILWLEMFAITLPPDFLRLIPLFKSLIKAEVLKIFNF